MMVPTPTLTECIVMRTRPFTKEGKTAKAALACSSHPMTTKVSPIESLASRAGGTASRLAHTSQFPHVRLWHLADQDRAGSRVRFGELSRHWARAA